MTVKGMLERDAIEYATLQDSVSRVQNLLFLGGLEGDALILMRRFVENAKSRMGQLEISAEQNQRKAEDEERSATVIREVVITRLVERETALNSEEKQEYRGLLGHEFFTKSMFGTLEHFYSKSWDKLTEGGKAQVSHRVWEGVRHGEYRFEELPEVVKQKEAKRLHDIMESPSSLTATVNIPVQDKREFCQAYERDDKREAYKILGRPSFTEYAGRDKVPTVTPENAEVQKKAVIEVEHSRPKEPNAVAKSSVPDESLRNFDLDAVALKELRDAQGEVAADPATTGRKTLDAGIKSK